MEAILDFSQPVDVNAIERVVQAMQVPDPQVIMAAQEVLSTFQDHPDGYTRVDAVLNQTQDPQTQYFALQVLDRAILSRWNVFPPEEQTGIRDFLVGFVMAQCQSQQFMRDNRFVVNRANATLISVAKREWPHRWPTFVAEVVSSASHSPAMAENAVTLLGMLVEEIFEFGEKTMTQRWMQRKRAALVEDFSSVWQLCGELLLNEDPVIQVKVLSCIEKCVPHVPTGMAFDAGFLSGVTGYIDHAPTRSAALRVLTEVAQLDAPQESRQPVEALFMDAVGRAIHYWFPSGDEAGGLGDKVQLLFAGGNQADEEFLDALCLFITKFLPNHVYALHTQSREALIAANDMIVGFLRLEHKEIFKTCVDYCWWLGDFIKNPRHGVHGTAAQLHTLLQPQLSDMRLTLVENMAKPEEVVIVEDEFGELQSEMVTDVEMRNLYITMREALVFLTHLDHRDMISIIERMMRKQVDGSEYSWSKLNVLCWSFGAISGALTLDLERNTFISFLRDLLTLCESKRTREDRAVIASGIMYVVGQYPRFLNAHPRFMRTVVAKNFDFTKEEFPGIRDMAVDTLLKVMRQCSSRLWDEASGVFARDIIGNMDFYSAELNHAQTCALFEACGYLMAAAPFELRENGIATLLGSPNAVWQQLIATARENGIDSITGTDDLKAIIHALRCINRAAKTSAGAFLHEMEIIFWDLQEVYTHFSGLVAKHLTERGAAALGLQQVKLLKTVKKEIMKTVEYFILNAEAPDFVAEKFVPHLFRAILVDYQTSAPEARDPQVLPVVTAAVRTLKGHLSEGIPHILDAVFDSTAELITVNAEEFPEHRVNLFALLKAITFACFEAFLEYVKGKPAVISGILWAAKHNENNTCQAGLDALIDFFQRVAMNEEAAAGFLAEFAQTIAVDTLIAMLDTLHRQAFKKQCVLLGRLFSVARRVEDASLPFSQAALSQTLTSTLSELPTLTADQIRGFVDASFSLCNDEVGFRKLFGDLMVEVQVWNAEQENMDIRADEKAERENAVEGLALPSGGGDAAVALDAAGNTYQAMAALNLDLEDG